MNLITAEFNWISFVLLVIAGIIGMLKSHAKKSDPHRKPPFPEFILREQEEKEEWTRVKETDESEKPLSAFQETGPEKEKNTVLTPKEEEEEQNISFDIRKAVISSEILRRPEF